MMSRLPEISDVGQTGAIAAPWRPPRHDNRQLCCSLRGAGSTHPCQLIDNVYLS
jgi:hypothetical protein